ncbi:UPF0175 family protein [Aerosakkonemataceae cyanobacterium BLCC-F50]|uniref:UPF0175 family protein n=1 Tax=Floridaenema flaviceps BLCC-F50 TaxID=3153642 RepID=A0ABV4XRT7_9CYAN
METEVKFNLEISQIPEAVRLEAEKKAKEAYVMTLLRHADISAGKAAKLLGIDRWQLSDLMSKYDISPFPDQTREELEREVEQAKRILEKYKK